jgi:nucleotide-binding universal stress UspA family protein
MHESRGPVVVGYDTSPAAARALDMAAEEAVAAGVPLVLVHVYGWPILYASLANIAFEPEDWRPSPEAVALAAAAAAKATQRHPGLSVRVSVPVGRAGEQLVAMSGRSSLLVVGASGARGLSGVLSGSVTPHVIAHARCPVMVARPGRTTGEVCVGVDGTPSSLDALRFAVAWAQARGAAVRAVYAADSGTFDEPVPGYGGRTPAEVRLRDWIEECVGAAGVDAAVVRRPAGSALLAASRGARLVVVGSRHRGELAGRVLGSVGQTLIRHAASPVVVVGGNGSTQDTPTTHPASLCALAGMDDDGRAEGSVR